MKKITLIILISVMCIGFCSCYDKEEVGNMAYLVAMGIDRDEYTFQFASFDGKLKLTNYSSHGDNIYVALDKINGQFAKKVDFSQLRVVVFSDNLNSYQLNDQMQFFVENPLINPGVTIGVCKGAAKDFMKSKDSGMDVIPTRYYEKVFNPEYTVYAPKTSVSDIERKEYNVLPYVSGTLEGIVIYGRESILGKTNGREARVYNILTERIKELRYDYKVDNESYVVKLSSMNPVYNIKLKDKPVISVDLILSCEPIINTKNFDTNELKNTLKNEMENFLYKCSRQFKADVFDFSSEAKKNYLTSEDWEKEDWDGLFSNAEFLVNIKINIVGK